jgi:pyruvate dehydrogenase E2 component (dihydrolipoamide acetyltransferase)
VKWLKKEGDTVQTGDMLAEVETDKATMELESFFDGVLLAVFVPAGSQVPLGAALCAIGKPGEKVEAAPGSPSRPGGPRPAPVAARPRSPAPVAAPAPEARPAAAAPAPSGGRIKVSPLARKLAAEKGLDLARITGSGPGGRILRADVLSQKAGGPSRRPRLPPRPQASPRARSRRSAWSRSPT